MEKNLKNGLIKLANGAPMCIARTCKDLNEYGIYIGSDARGTCEEISVGGFKL